MNKRFIAVLLIVILAFSLVACSSADDEEGAQAGSVTVDNVKNDSDTATDSQDSTDKNETPDTNDSTDDGAEEQEPAEDDNQNEPAPDLNTEGKYTVTFDYGYDSKKETEKTDGAVTEVTPTRDGYSFLGWFKGSDRFDFSTPVSSDTKLTAKWEALTYTITYVANGATLPSDNPTSYTVSNKVISLKEPTYSGKVFLGWSVVGGKETYTSESIAADTYGNLTITPVWDENAITFGKYEQNGDTTSTEPIIWSIIKKEGDRALVISRDILDARQYDPSGGDSVKWWTCGLRNFLNETFYKKAFTQDEKGAVILTEVKTEGKFDGSVSQDYVFLLSLEEVKEYFSGNMARRANVTKYAENNGAQNSPEGGWWWLRTKCSSYGASLVENTGNVRDGGYTGSMKSVGVRPVMWVDLSKL